jgi:hypothetical protein
MIVNKMCLTYALVASSDILLHKFFDLKQEKGEKIHSFSIRLEAALDELRTKDPSLAFLETERGGLRERLFYGMKKSLRDSLRYMYKDPTVGYNQLLREARTAETESESPPAAKPKSASSKEASATFEPCNNGMVEAQRKMETSLRDLQASLKAIQSQKSKGGSGKVVPAVSTQKADTVSNVRTYKDPAEKDWRNPSKCFKCGGYGHIAKDCPSRLNSKRGAQQEGAQNSPPKEPAPTQERK